MRARIQRRVDVVLLLARPTIRVAQSPRKVPLSQPDSFRRNWAPFALQLKAMPTPQPRRPLQASVAQRRAGAVDVVDAVPPPRPLQRTEERMPQPIKVTMPQQPQASDEVAPSPTMA